MSDKAQTVLVGIHGDDLLDGYERLKKERDDALTRIAELEGARAKAMEGAAPEFCEFEKTFRAPYNEQPEALRKVSSAILFDELDRRANVIAAQAAELARLRKFSETIRENQRRCPSSWCLEAIGILDRVPAQAEPQAPLLNEKQHGIYRKFRVERTDGSSDPGGKHERCEYFVLDWMHDKFAVPAARAYADACSREFPELARDLRTTANEVESLHRPAGREGGGR